MNDRHTRILQLLGNGEISSVTMLSDSLNVSTVTIRQDLNSLESEGLITRVHGGALLNNSDDIAHRMGIYFKQKLLIARKAVEYIDDGDTILIESGSVNALLAKELYKFNELTVITSNVFIAQQMRKYKHLKVILLGGMYQHESESMIGSLAKQGIDTINFNKAFIGIDGFMVETGFTSKDMHRAEISSYIISKSKYSIVLTDSSKFGHTELSKICDADSVDHIITDKSVPEHYLSYFKNIQVELIRV